MITVIVEFDTRCDIISMPATRFAAFAYAFNRYPVRYWIHARGIPSAMPIRINGGAS